MHLWSGLGANQAAPLLVPQLVQVELDYELHDGLITHKTAAKVHQALVVDLVVGGSIPPSRLNFIKTLNHPRWVGSAQLSDLCSQLPVLSFVL